MSMQSLTELVKADQDHLIHSLHHPIDHADPLICVKGRGAMITDVHGREYLDGLAGLWNVNVGHGREELAEAAAAQMKELSYFSTYVGSSNIPAINLADRRDDAVVDGDIAANRLYAGTVGDGAASNY